MGTLQARVEILVVLLSNCGILGKSFHFPGLSFLMCKMRKYTILCRVTDAKTLVNQCRESINKITWEPKRFKDLSVIPSIDTKNPLDLCMAPILHRHPKQTHPKLPIARQAWGGDQVLATKIA